MTLDDVRSLIDAPSPAVLTTYRKNEAVPPFRAVEVKGEPPELVERDVTEVREVIAGRYLGAERGRRFAGSRPSPRGTLLRLVPNEPRIWDLAAAIGD